MYCNKKRYNWRTMDLRSKIYAVILLVGLLNIFFFQPVIAHADLFGYEIQDVYAEITEKVKETNDILGKAFEFSKISPYDVVNSIAGTVQGNLAISIRNASKTMALIVATLLLMMDFFKKTINFEWASKWENILMFLVKIIVIKQVVQNADVIVGYLYAGFQTINDAAIGTTTDFLPCGTITDYYSRQPQSVVEHLQKGWWDFWVDVGAGSTYNDYIYPISEEAVKIFYPNAVFGSTDLNSTPLANPTTRLNFMPTLEYIMLKPYLLIMEGLAYIVFVITIGRVFELTLYTMFAPLPLATFASDVSSDIAKSFIKNYIATVLQIAVIATMFVVYVAVNKYITTAYAGTKLIQLIVLGSLALSVFKSGTWSRKICGIG